MLPDFAADDVSSNGFRHTKQCSKLTMSDAASGVESTNLNNLFKGEFRTAMRLASRHALRMKSGTVGITSCYSLRIQPSRMSVASRPALRMKT